MAVLERGLQGEESFPDTWLANVPMSGTEKNRAQSKRQWLIFIVPVVLSCVVVALAALGATRGFSFADEAFYYSLIENGVHAPAGPFTFHLLLNPLFEALGSTILSFRILRIVGYLLVAATLGAVISGLLRQRGFSGWQLLAFPMAMAVVGVAWSWSFPPPAVSYNEVAVWSSVLAAGLVLLSDRSTSIWGASLLNLTGGLVLSVAVFNKFLSGLTLTLFLVVVLCLLPGPSTRLRRLFHTACLIAGLGLGAVALTAGGLPFAAVSREAWSALFDPSLSGAWLHGVDDLLAGAISVPAGLVSGMNRGGWLMLVASVVLFGLGREQLLKMSVSVPKWCVQTGIATAVLLGMVPIGLDWRVGNLAVFGGFPAREASMGLALAMALILTAVGAKAASRRRLPSPAIWEAWFPLAALCLVPLIVSVGTNNSLLGHAIYAGFVWFAVIGAACGLLLIGATDAMQDYFVLATLVGFGLAAVMAMFSGTWLTPYLQDQPLLRQNSYTDSPLLRGIRLSREQAGLVDRLGRQAARNGFSLRGAFAKPVIAIGDDLQGPGRLLFFNNSAFAYPFLLSEVPGSYSSIVEACGDNARSPHILTGGPGVLDSMKDATMADSAIEACGAKYPEDYRAVQLFKDRGNWVLGIWRAQPRDEPGRLVR